MNEHLVRLVRQHAETSRLLGVDFVPRYRVSQPIDAQIFGEGEMPSRLMFVGDAPEPADLEAGRLFVGPAGQLLGKMIQAMGLKREAVYLTHVVKGLPAGGQGPSAREVAIGRAILFDQIAAVRPEVIVTLGLCATQAVLGTAAGEAVGAAAGAAVGTMLESLRGKWAELKVSDALPGEPKHIAVMPTLDPKFVVANYNPENRALAWNDLKMVMERLGLTPTGAKK